MWPGPGLVPGGHGSPSRRISTTERNPLLGLEVVEHVLVGDAGRRRDGRQCDVVEGLREEQLHGGAGDALTCGGGDTVREAAAMV